MSWIQALIDVVEARLVEGFELEKKKLVDTLVQLYRADRGAIEVIVDDVIGRAKPGDQVKAIAPGAQREIEERIASIMPGPAGVQ